MTGNLSFINSTTVFGCLPIDKTVLGNETLSLIPGQFAVEPGLSQVEGWSTNWDHTLLIIYSTCVHAENENNKKVSH